MEVGKILIYLGLFLVVAGVLWIVFAKLGVTPGRLPGDIVFKKENVSFYFPITTSILLSIIISLIIWFVRR